MVFVKIFPESRLGLQTLLGWLAVFVSAFCFYLATAAIRWAQPRVDISPAYFAFFRFFLGYVAVCLLLLIKRQDLAPKRYDLLIGQYIANDPELGPAGWLGALLLFLANVVLALRRSRRLPDPAAPLTPADGSG